MEKIFKEQARSTNRLINSPYYTTIIKEYNDELAAKGKVNNSKFFRENISPRIPNYSPTSFAAFLKRFKSALGIQPYRLNSQEKQKLFIDKQLSKAEEEKKLGIILKTSEEATRQGIMKALNIGEKAMQEIMDDVSKLSPEKRAEFLFKGMRSMDSRAQATAILRKDSRDEKAFNKYFGSAAYQGDEEDGREI